MAGWGRSKLGGGVQRAKSASGTRMTKPFCFIAQLCHPLLSFAPGLMRVVFWSSGEKIVVEIQRWDGVKVPKHQKRESGNRRAFFSVFGHSFLCLWPLFPAL